MWRAAPFSDYASSEARVLRKADGTGFFVVAPRDAAVVAYLPAGQYRLVLTYRYDNRSTDPDSPVLSEAGNKDTEVVAIDVPWEERNENRAISVANMPLLEGLKERS